MAQSPLRVLIALFLLLQSGCGVGFIGTTASSFLHRIRDSDDPNVRYLAYTKLADPNCYSNESEKDEAAGVLIEALNGKEQSLALRAAACRTLGELGRPAARVALIKASRDPEPLLRAEACRALGKVGTTEDATVLALMMTTDLSRDCRVAAIEALGELKPVDARIDLKLVEGMQSPDPAIRTASYGALRSITDEDLGIDFRPWQELAQGRMVAQARAASGTGIPLPADSPPNLDAQVLTTGAPRTDVPPPLPR